MPGFEHLRGHKLLPTRNLQAQRGGSANPRVVSGSATGGFTCSEADVAKVTRIRNDPRVRVAPCTARGKPLAPPAEGRARVLDQPSDGEEAETALQANYGLGRKIYEGAGGALGTATVYLEITPA